MKTTIYVDWEKQEILQEPDKKEWIAEYVSNRLLYEDNELENYLDGTNYSKSYLLKATEKEKEEILGFFEKQILEEAEEEFYDEYEEITIEI